MKFYIKKNCFYVFGLSFVLIAIFCPKGLADAGSNNSDIIKSSRTVLEKWIETERIISKETAELEIAKQMLNNRIELISREIEVVKSAITESERNISQADEKRQELIEENDKYKDASLIIADNIELAEQRLLNSLKLLPTPLQERVKPLSQRITPQSKQSSASISERFQNVVGILNEIDKFNQTITVVSELRDLDSGESIEVVTMYVGIGQGYYVNNSGEIAGVGSLGSQGWHWQQDNSIAAEVATAIAIIKNEKAASFVRLPTTIK